MLCRTISGGSLLYTQINPSALRLSISKKCSLRISISCLLCRPVPDLVQCRSAVDSIKNFLKCSGPLPIAALCNKPIIAMSRLQDNGAKLRCTIVSSADVPYSSGSAPLAQLALAFVHFCVQRFVCFSQAKIAETI